MNTIKTITIFVGFVPWICLASYITPGNLPNTSFIGAKSIVEMDSEITREITQDKNFKEIIYGIYSGIRNYQFIKEIEEVKIPSLGAVSGLIRKATNNSQKSGKKLKKEMLELGEKLRQDFIPGETEVPKAISDDLELLYKNRPEFKKDWITSVVEKSISKFSQTFQIAHNTDKTILGDGFRNCFPNRYEDLGANEKNRFFSNGMVENFFRLTKGIEKITLNMESEHDARQIFQFLRLRYSDLSTMNDEEIDRAICVGILGHNSQCESLLRFEGLDFETVCNQI